MSNNDTHPTMPLDHTEECQSRPPPLPSATWSFFCYKDTREEEAQSAFIEFAEMMMPQETLVIIHDDEWKDDESFLSRLIHIDPMLPQSGLTASTQGQGLARVHIASQGPTFCL